MTATLVGIGGFAQTGKDTVADHLVAEHGWQKEYMSRALETALLKLNPWVNIVPGNWKQGAWPKGPLAYETWIRYASLHHLVGYEVSKNCLDVRDYLQKLGTEIGRNMFHSDVWVRWAFRQVDEAMEAGRSVAITGIRFPNELEWVAERGGHLVWIDRPGFGPVNSHDSDNLLNHSHFSLRIPNDGTPEDLYRCVDRLVRNVWTPEAVLAG